MTASARIGDDTAVVTFSALPPHRWPRTLWTVLVSPWCNVKIDDDVHRVAWGQENGFELPRGAHRFTVFHELGTSSAPACRRDVDVMGPLRLEYRARFWPFRPGELRSRRA
jgi:hypothetical protein